MPNFADIAKKKLADIERPPLPPVGTYRWHVTKVPGVREGDKWDIVDFQCQAVEAQDDVDPEAVADYGDVTKIFNRVSFLFDKEDSAAFAQTEYNMRRFLADTLQIDGAEKMELTEAMAASVNCQFLGALTHKQDKNDPEVFHANMGRTAPVG